MEKDVQTEIFAARKKGGKKQGTHVCARVCVCERMSNQHECSIRKRTVFCIDGGREGVVQRSYMAAVFVDGGIHHLDKTERDLGLGRPAPSASDVCILACHSLIAFF